jgi:hypothetical protein
MPKYKVMIAQFPYGNSTHPAVSDWVTETLVKCRDDARIGPGNVTLWRKADTPITMTRNQCLARAEALGIDYVLMVDSDMEPDLPYPDAKPFWDTAWEFALAHPGPCVVAAPYCGPPPVENVYAFRWEPQQSDNPDVDAQLNPYSRTEAAGMRGVQRAAALATGLMLIDMRAIRKMPHPRFYYEWKGDGPRCSHCGMMKAGEQIHKASTEDVTFSRDLTLLGIPIWCAWDCWAGHWKPKCVGKPNPISPDAIPDWMRQRGAELADGPAAPPPAEETALPPAIARRSVQPMAVDHQ